MSFPILLSSLPEREAIIDALYRATMGIDTNDAKLFDSAWVNREDAIFEMDGNAMNGLDEIHKSIFSRVGPLVTTHYVSNIRIDHKQGADIASFTAYALNQHYRTGEGLTADSKRLLAGAWYWIDVVKDASSGVWRMKKWNMKLVWIEGDASIVMPS